MAQDTTPIFQQAQERPRVYLDYNATAPPHAEVMEVAGAMGHYWGNPSSVHAEGRRARHLVEDAREKVAKLVGCPSSMGVIFTSGGTEANHLALRCFDGAKSSSRPILLSCVEHSSLLEAAQQSGHGVSLIPVDGAGLVRLDALERILKQQALQAPLVSVMLANNETGVIQPIRKIADLVHGAGGLLHCDGVQGVGKMPVDMQELGVDMLSLSAHKIGGLCGCGALVLARSLRVDPFAVGGGQEFGYRAGTENLLGVMAFGVACEISLTQLTHTMETTELLRDYLEKTLQADFAQISIFGKTAPRLPNTSCFALPHLDSQTLVIGLDMAGFAVSAGSACSSGKVSRSHVLKAMGVEETLSLGAIRVSLGAACTLDNVKHFAACWGQLARKTRQNTTHQSAALRVLS